MAKEKGLVNENLEAVLPVRLANGAIIECVLDTGLNGSLLLPREFVKANSILFAGREEVVLVEEISAEIDTAITEAIWLSERFSIRVLVQRNERSVNRNTNAG